MRIRIFRAASLAEAMAQVRDELGLDALIMDTETRAGLVEVTAALDTEDEPEPAARFDPLPDLAPDLPASPVSATQATAPLSRHNLPPALLSALEDGPLDAACSRLFRFSRLPLDADGAPLLLAGPPGGGKTLTVAKLATRLVMEGHRPLVITADEQRAGAIEQLAAFTRLLGLTLIAAGRPEMLARALGRREALSPVLIDAPGLNLLDPAQDALQADLIAASGACSALVLPAGLDPAEAQEVAEAHALHGVQLLVPTRLDHAARLGGVLAACRSGGLALTEAGIGADVADGLTRLTPVTLATRLAAAAPARGQASASPSQPPPPLRERTETETQPIAKRHGALSLHIAAQAGVHRLPSRKTNP